MSQKNQINLNSIVATESLSSPIGNRFRTINPLECDFSGEVTLNDFVTYINNHVPFIEVKETKKNIKVRLYSYLVGSKFVITPLELFDLDNIIRKHFIKSNKIVRNHAKIRKIIPFLLDVCFDINVNFELPKTQALGDYVSQVAESIAHDNSFMEGWIFTNVRYSMSDPRWTLENALEDYLTNAIYGATNHKVHLPKTSFTSRSYFETLDVCFERLTFSFPLKIDDPNYGYFYECFEIAYERLRYFGYYLLTEESRITRMQSGPCEKSGYAYLEPAVMQSYFDFGFKSIHTVDEKTEKIIENLLNISRGAKDSLETFTGNTLKTCVNSIVKSFTGGVSVKIEGLDELISRFDTMVEGIKRAVICLVLFIVFKLIKMSGLFSNLTLSIIGSIFAAYGFHVVFGPEIWTTFLANVRYVIGYEDIVIIQSGYSDVDKPIDAFLACMQLATLGKAWYYEADMLNAFKKSVTGWDKFKIDFSDSINTWFTLFQRFMDFISEKLSMKPWKIWEGKYPELTKFVEATNQFLEDCEKDPILTFQKGRRLEALLKDGRACFSTLPLHAVHERNLFRSVSDNLNNWKVKLGKANFLGSGPRVKPVGILFTGPSQIGKSEFNNVFCRLVAARCLPFERVESFVKNPSSEVYNRVIEQEYWDGWQDQSIIQIDELGARKDVEGQNNEYFETMRIVNGNTFGLHSAGIDEKGMCFARPILFACTSNNLRFKCNSLTFQKAFENRLIAYAVVPKREYLEDPECDVFNFESVQMKEMEDWCYEFEHLEMWKYDLTIARKTGSIQQALLTDRPEEPMEVLEQVIAKIVKNQEFGQKILSVHDKMIRDHLNRRSDAEAIKDLLKDVEQSVDEYEKLNNCSSEADYMKLLDEALQDLHKAKTQAKNNRSKAYGAVLAALSSVAMIVMFYDMMFPKTPGQDESGKLKVTRGFIGKEVWKTIKDEYANVKQALKDTKEAASCSKEYADHFIREKIPVYIQAAREYSRKTFGCGDCLVCRAHEMNIHDFLAAGKDNSLWPEGSEQIRKEWNNLNALTPLEIELMLSSPVVPWCLKLKKDVWYKPDSVVRFKNSELYAQVTFAYISGVISGMAKNSRRNLIRKVNSSLNLGRKGLYKIAENWKIVSASVMALSVAGTMLYTLFTKIYPQSVSPRSGRSKLFSKAGRSRNKVKFQSARDGIIDNVMNKVLTRCQYRIGKERNDNSFGVITMLTDQIGVMPLHFAEMLTYAYEEEQRNFWITPAMSSDNGSKVHIPFQSIVFYETGAYDYTSDYMLFSIEKSFMPPAPNILKYFVSKDNSPKEKYHGALFINRIVGGNIMILKQDGAVKPDVEVFYTDGSFDNETAFKLSNAHMYSFDTKEGDCGSLLVKYSHDGNPERIVGFHVSGTDFGTGYSQPLYREDLTTLVELIKKKTKLGAVKEVEHPVLDDNTPAYVEGFTGLGRKKGPRPSKMSKIVPSPLNNVAFECKTAPAVLKDYKNEKGVFVDPLEEARKIYSGHSYFVDPYLLECVVQDTISDITNNSVIVENLVGPRDLTFEEAAYGIPGHEYCNGARRSAAPGFPRNQERGNDPGTKHLWLGPKGGKDILDESDPHYKDLKDSVELIIKDANDGIRKVHYVQDFAKDERRSKEKVALKKTRFISGTSMDYSLACCMKFGALCEWLMSNKIHNGFCVGVNCFGDEWNAIAARMRMKGEAKDWTDGDFAGFDGCHTRQLMYTFKELADAYYGNTDLGRDVLLEDLINSIHIYKGVVYLWSKALPSGHFLTTMINCWINLLLHKIGMVKTYIRLNNVTMNPMSILNALEIYREAIITLVYGDDNFHRVGDKAKPYFTIEEHAISLLEIGYVYTDAQKTGMVTEFINWRELSFLKRKFRKHETLKTIVAPLSTKTLEDMVQWTKIKDVDLVDLRKNVDKALMEMAFHPQDEFNVFRDKLLKACNSVLQYRPAVVDYKQLAIMNYGRNEFL